MRGFTRMLGIAAGTFLLTCCLQTSFAQEQPQTLSSLLRERDRPVEGIEAGSQPVPVLQQAVTVQVLDGRPVAARVSVVAGDGKPYAPQDVPLREIKEGASYFYTGGSFQVALPNGPARLEVARGIEYVPARVDVDVSAKTRLTVRLTRWTDMAKRGWYSGDSHVHLHTGGPLEVGPAEALLAARAEDVNYVNLCVSNNVGDDIRDAEMITGRPHEVSDGSHLLVFGEEMRSMIYGHMQFFGIKKLVEPQYTGFDDTPRHHDYPANYDQAAEAVRQGGVVTYGHPMFADQADPFAGDPTKPNAAARELPVDAILGVAHAIDLMSYNSDETISAQLWYRLLNCGLPLAATVGTDALLDQSTNPLGGQRMYVKVDGELTMERWLAGLRAGRTFVTNGPMLALKVDGHGIGETVSLDAAGSVRVEAELRSYVPVETLEIVVNGEVPLRVPCPKKKETNSTVVQRVAVDVPVESSSWIAVRARGPKDRHVIGGPAWAHTSPVYVKVAGKPISSPDDAAYFVAWIDKLLHVVGTRNRYATAEDRQGVEDLFRKAQGRFRELASGAGH